VSASADYYDMPANYSYLTNTAITSISSPFIIIDKAHEDQWVQQYRDMNRDYDNKCMYGTLSIEDKITYNNANSAFSQSMVDSIKNYQIDQRRNIAVNNLKKDPTVIAVIDKAKTPAAIAGGAWALYRGTSIPIKVTENTSLSAGASVHNRSASLGLSSPIINTNVSVDQNGVTTSVNRGIVEHVSAYINNYRPSQASIPWTSVGINYGISL
jgi:hypothetical protein